MAVVRGWDGAGNWNSKWERDELLWRDELGRNLGALEEERMKWKESAALSLILAPPFTRPSYKPPPQTSEACSPLWLYSLLNPSACCYAHSPTDGHIRIVETRCTHTADTHIQTYTNTYIYWFTVRKHDDDDNDVEGGSSGTVCMSLFYV